MKIARYFIGISLVILTGSYVFSQDSASVKNYKMNSIIVTGSKTAVSRNNIPLTVSVISKETIENSSESQLLTVISENVPGVFVTERGITGFGVSTGSAGQISIRGVGGSPTTRTLVLLNGNPQYMGIFGHPLADAYIASDAEKVEIIRGPASVLYGSNAMGGVINIITKQADKNGLSANARTMFGSYNTQKYMINSGYKEGNFNVFASFNHDQTDGHRPNSYFKINNGFLETGYELSNNFDINADFSLENFDAQDPGAEGSAPGNILDITRGMGALVFNDKFNNTNGSVRFFYNFGEHNISDGFHSNDFNYGLVAYQSLILNNTTITAGTDIKQYGGKAENTKAMNGAGIVLGDKSISEVAGYINAQQMLFNKLVLNAGIRLDNNSVYGNEVVPAGGFSYSLTSSTVFKMSVAKGFRSPTMQELYLFPPANEELEPEKMVNYEASVIQSCLNNTLEIELTYFNLKAENLIQTIFTNGVPKNVNTGEVKNQGIEFSGKIKVFDNLSFNSNYSYTDMENPVVGMPEHKLFISGNYSEFGISLNISGQYVSKLYTSTNPVIEEKYFLLNSKIGYKVNSYADVFVKLENILDEKYYINAGYPMPGAVVFGGINLHY